MRKFLIGIAAIATGLLAPGTAAAAPGDLDTTFGSPNGFVTTPLTVDPLKPHSGAIQDVLVEPGTGKILAVVDITPTPAASLCPFGLARFLPGGALDPSFGAGGFGLHPGISDICVTGGLSDVPFAVARTNDGKYVVAGQLGDDILLVRLLANGELDPDFDGDPVEDDGRVITDVPGASFIDRVAGVHVASDGAITVAATAEFPGGPPSGSTIVVARYDEDGALDPSFDETPTVAPTGMVFVEGPGDEETGNGMLVDPSGRTVVAGSSTDATPQPGTQSTQIFVTRLTATGARDAGFSGDGIHEFGLGSVAGPDVSTDVVRHPDGRLVLAVSQDALVTPASFAVAALTDAGALDAGFGTGGSTVAPLVPGPGGGVGEIGVPTRLARQPDGKLVVVGNRLVPPGPSFIAALVRFRADGLVDTTYGSQGVAEPAPFPTPDPAISAVDIDAEGRAVVGGVVQNNPPPYVPLLARFQGDSPPVAGPPVVPAPAPAPATPSAATGQRAAALKKCKKKKGSKRKKCKKRAKKLPV
jgi:uncharacterized delta-60 repeat protein